MFERKNYTGTREENYHLLVEQLSALMKEETDCIANLANAASLLNQFLPNINWVGFYLFSEDQLVLGPFQGLPACTRIPIGKGVCGTAAKEQKILCIDDVRSYEGHIACDESSRSELVIPLVKQGALIGVLDIDSPMNNRFDEVDVSCLSKFCNTLLAYI